DEFVKNEADINVVDNTVNNEEEESDSEAVFDTYFGDNGDAQEDDNEVDQTLNDKVVSKVPFKIYDLLNRHNKEVGLNDIQLEGYSFTWVLSSATKMSKLDRFLVTDGLLSFFPHLSAVCLDRHLSDHRPILLQETLFDFGATPFRM
nr:RNA-directed DNA polymerase, eukaryota [Tanacetum cinerariifolium]